MPIKKSSMILAYKDWHSTPASTLVSRLVPGHPEFYPEAEFQDSVSSWGSSFYYCGNLLLIFWCEIKLLLPLFSPLHPHFPCLSFSIRFRDLHRSANVLTSGVFNPPPQFVDWGITMTLLQVIKITKSATLVGESSHITVITLSSSAVCMWLIYIQCVVWANASLPAEQPNSSILPHFSQLQRVRG